MEAIETRDVAAPGRGALVVMTRAPRPGATKTRMMPDLTPCQCAQLHAALLADAARLARSCADCADTLVAYAPPDAAGAVRAAFSAPARYFEQSGRDLGESMRAALREARGLGYDRVALVGADAPETAAEDIRTALRLLDDVDLVLGPAADGGFYLLAAQSVPDAVLGLSSYGHGGVLEQTVAAARAAGCSYALLAKRADLDCWEDALALLARADADPSLEALATVRYLRGVCAARREEAGR